MQSRSCSNSCRNPSVAELLGIDIKKAEALPRYDPQADCPAWARRRSPRRGRYQKRAVVDAGLGPFVVDARAGVSDEMIAHRAGFSREQVRQWRRRMGIKGRISRTPPLLSARYAIDALLNKDTQLLQHFVASSPVKGRWRAPEYVLRTPLKYDTFAEVVAYACARFRVDELAEGLGFEARDIEDALRLHNARRPS